MIDKRKRGRLLTVALLLLVSFGGLGYRLGDLHLAPSDLRRNELQRLRCVEKTIMVHRGRIYDRRGNPVALDLSLKDLIADPEQIRKADQVESVSRSLARVLEMDPREIAERIDRPGRRFERVRRFMEESEVKQVSKLGLPGVYFREVSARYYPKDSLMCHIIGFSDHDGVGSSGVEQTMDRFLRGCPGFLESRMDGRRRELYGCRIQDVAPQEGADVHLTLDQHVQYVVEKALDKIMEEHRALGAWAIIQRVRTGEILAMASRPAFDPNKFFKTSETERLNRAIGYVYEPGSTMKILTIAAALNEGLVTPSTVIDCENGAWWHQGRLLRDHHSYGKLSVADTLKKSSSIGAAKIAVERIGKTLFSDYLTRFKIGSKLGIDLPGEESGILHAVDKWSGISCSRIAIGQGVSMTALQMLGVLCAIGNGGVMMRPYVVDRVVAKDGAVLYESEPMEIGRPIDRNTAEVMKRLLARVTEDGGTGRRARVDGYAVGGKTGTAQKPESGGYSETDYMASFVGFLPVTKPEIGIIVVVDRPQPLHTGGAVAAPAFAEIADQAVRYLGLFPARTAQALVASSQ